MSKTQKIGIFSGTFDPFHIAHLEACLVAKSVCDLTSVLIMVEKMPKHKNGVSAYEIRVNMIDLATSEYPSLRLIDATENNITIDNTLPTLQSQFPGAEYWYIIGSDTVNSLHSWKGLNRLFDNLKFCVILRKNEDKDQAKTQLLKLKKEYKNLTYKILPAVWSEVSSSKIRKQIKATGFSPLLHRDVMRYVSDKKIY
jgi:nicotinate-nucleotide adenylyltransferase